MTDIVLPLNPANWMDVIVLGTKTLLRFGISLKEYEAIVDNFDDIIISVA